MRVFTYWAAAAISYSYIPGRVPRIASATAAAPMSPARRSRCDLVRGLDPAQLVELRAHVGEREMRHRRVDPLDGLRGRGLVAEHRVVHRHGVGGPGLAARVEEIVGRGELHVELLHRRIPGGEGEESEEALHRLDRQAVGLDRLRHVAQVGSGIRRAELGPLEREDGGLLRHAVQHQHQLPAPPAR